MQSVSRAGEILTVNPELFALTWQAPASQPHLQVGSEGMEVWSLHHQPTRKCWQLHACARLRAGQPSMLCAPDHGRTIYLSDDNSRMRADWQVGLTSLCTFLPVFTLLSDSVGLLLAAAVLSPSAGWHMQQPAPHIGQAGPSRIRWSPSDTKAFVMVCRWT